MFSVLLNHFFLEVCGTSLHAELSQRALRALVCQMEETMGTLASWSKSNRPDICIHGNKKDVIKKA